MGIAVITQNFIIDGKYLGVGPRKPKRVHETAIIPWSMVFFCAKCGQVYAMCPVTDSLGNVSEFQAFQGLCLRHPPTKMYSQIPGSIWQSWDKEFLEALPMPVLQYELERHMQAYERLENHV